MVPMAIGAERVHELVKNLLSDKSKEREEACDTIRDWRSSFSENETRLLAMLISVVVLVEQDGSSREAELFALTELVDSGFVRMEHVSMLNGIDKASLDPSELEYIDYLLTDVP